MSVSVAPLTAFTEAIMARHLDRFEPIVKAAYAAGFDRQQLLAAVEVAKLIADVPPAVSGQAYLTVHAWNWMTYRSREPRAALAPHPVGHGESAHSTPLASASAISVSR